MLQPSFGAMAPPPSPPTIERLEILEATESSDSESELSSTIDLAWIPSPPGGRPFAVPPSPKSEVSSIVTRIPPSITAGRPVVGLASPESEISSTFTRTPPSAISPPGGRLTSTLALHIKGSTPKSSSHSVEKAARTTRSLARKYREAQDAQSYTLEKLSSDWEVKVGNALKHGHGSYTVHDLAKLVPPPHLRDNEMSAWLNDEVINGYLNIICAHGNKDVKPGDTPRFHAFSSFFMSNLMDPSKGPSSVKRWATRAKIGGKNLTKVDKLFIPINPGNHWTLLVVSPKAKEITHYNSLRGGGARYIQKITEWLKQEIGNAFVEEDWTLTPNGQSPQQANISDCGVFTITSAKQIMLGHSVMTYGAKEIPTQRRRIVAELVAGKLIRGSG
jgi:Ulp1 protease family, C-terminal catalytic domain